VRSTNTLMKSSCRFLVALFCGVAASMFAQYPSYVYHGVGPVRFTNAAAFGYPDGSLAGTNFYCGVYAGTDASSLLPQFGVAPSGLKHSISPSGWTAMSGSLTFTAPPGASVVFQLRVWPAQFDTYEQALSSSIPSPPVGVSSLWEAIAPEVIVELPIQTGPMWLTPIPEPSPLDLLALAGAATYVRRSWLNLGIGAKGLWRMKNTESLLAGRH